ncbi:SUN domain-containing protein 2-like [Anas platyrhynchos]|uniref:SUN domain-containing protein 2-like n=1 Tax=Anas platyrhynchos TaxID=8839 RepID=UPI000F7C682F|eukprot:XP_027304355.1 SUN domain-containing protein 2-like isoform X1 [Anas platyrhynchos]
MPARLGRKSVTHQKGRRILKLLFLLLPVLFAGDYCWTLWGKEALQTTLEVPEAEHKSTGTSLVWHDPKRQELQEKEAHMSAAVEQFVQAVSKVLEDNHIRGEKRENVLHFTRDAFEKVLKIYTWMPDWALKSLGATIDVQRTSKSYGGKDAKKWWIFPLFSFAKHPETILQPSISPGDCWAFRGSQGHVVIRLPVKIWPAAFTIWHISRAVSPSGEVSSAPKEFAVSGVDEDKAETLLGLFTYDVDGMIAQTFHVQKEPPKTFRHIRLEVRSNWGNPEYTCIYRVQVHGQIEKPQEFIKHE